MFGCVRNSGGVWYFREAKLPADWPELTPVGKVQVKEYPAYREAVVTDEQVDPTQRAMFNALFQHIKTNEIAMTAPVEMTYDADAGDAAADASGGGAGMRSMAFLYDVPERGPTGQRGEVTVRDVPPMTVASIGVRGSYQDEKFDDARQTLRDWLAGQSEWRAVGPPRMLGYNSPFVPWFWRYGEVQVPVEPAG